MNTIGWLPLKNCCGWLPPKGDRNLWFPAILIIIKLTLHKTMSGHFHVPNMHVHTCGPLRIPQPHTFEPPLMSRFKVFHHLTWNFSGPDWAALLVTLINSMIFHNFVCVCVCVRARVPQKKRWAVSSGHSYWSSITNTHLSFTFFACSLCYLYQAVGAYEVWCASINCIWILSLIFSLWNEDWSYWIFFFFTRKCL